MKREEHTLGSLLSDAMYRAGVAQQVTAAVIVQAADQALEDLFGEGVLEHIRAHVYANQELTLVSRHPVLSTEVRQKREALIEGISARVPAASVRELTIIHRDSTHRKAAWYDV